MIIKGKIVSLRILIREVTSAKNRWLKISEATLK